MSVDDIYEHVRQLIIDQRFAEAEALLRDARDRGFGSEHELGLLDLLVEVYSLREPPELSKADAVCLERERLAKTAYSMLQTAMLRHWRAHDYVQSVLKAREAIAAGRREDDDSTVYSALALLGLGLIELGNDDAVKDVIDEIEQMISRRKRIIIGDETTLLERARTRGLNVSTIRRIANRLAPNCRDPEFSKRLNALAAENWSE